MKSVGGRGAEGALTRLEPEPAGARCGHLISSSELGAATADALTELYRRHERRVYNLALRTLGNPWDAADVAQEAFIKAFRNLDSFKGEARFTTWLHRIVVNAAYDHLRRQRPEPMDGEILDDISGPGGAGAVVGSGREGIDPAIDGLSDPLRDALMSLNEGFRFAVVLCDLLGFPYNEAAEILGVQEGTIKSRIFRAREALGGGSGPRQGTTSAAANGTPVRTTASHRRVQRGNDRG